MHEAFAKALLKGGGHGNSLGRLLGWPCLQRAQESGVSCYEQWDLGVSRSEWSPRLTASVYMTAGLWTLQVSKCKPFLILMPLRIHFRQLSPNHIPSRKFNTIDDCPLIVCISMFIFVCLLTFLGWRITD